MRLFPTKVSEKRDRRSAAAWRRSTFAGLEAETRKAESVAGSNQSCESSYESLSDGGTGVNIRDASAAETEGIPARKVDDLGGARRRFLRREGASSVGKTNGGGGRRKEWGWNGRKATAGNGRNIGSGIRRSDLVVAHGRKKNSEKQLSGKR